MFESRDKYTNDRRTLVTISRGGRLWQPTNTRYKAANIENEYSGAELAV